MFVWLAYSIVAMFMNANVLFKEPYAVEYEVLEAAGPVPDPVGPDPDEYELEKVTVLGEAGPSTVGSPEKNSREKKEFVKVDVKGEVRAVKMD